jgi:hypothetical protein
MKVEIDLEMKMVIDIEMYAGIEMNVKLDIEIDPLNVRQFSSRFLLVYRQLPSFFHIIQ